MRRALRLRPAVDDPRRRRRPAPPRPDRPPAGRQARRRRLEGRRSHAYLDAYEARGRGARRLNARAPRAPGARSRRRSSPRRRYWRQFDPVARLRGHGAARRDVPPGGAGARPRAERGRGSLGRRARVADAPVRAAPCVALRLAAGDGRRERPRSAARSARSSYDRLATMAGHVHHLGRLDPERRRRTTTRPSGALEGRVLVTGPQAATTTGSSGELPELEPIDVQARSLAGARAASDGPPRARRRLIALSSAGSRRCRRPARGRWRWRTAHTKPPWASVWRTARSSPSAVRSSAAPSSGQRSPAGRARPHCGQRTASCAGAVAVEEELDPPVRGGLERLRPACARARGPRPPPRASARRSSDSRSACQRVEHGRDGAVQLRPAPACASAEPSRRPPRATSLPSASTNSARGSRRSRPRRRAGGRAGESDGRARPPPSR